MPKDIRESVARYYDLSPAFPNDLPFYEARIHSADVRILELGCGTGRVLVPLVDQCAFILGVDASDAMLSFCREKLALKGVSRSRVAVMKADIASLDLAERFDLIIAPFRVFQNLETDNEVNGFFRTVRYHLSPKGTAVLNVFMPYMDPEKMRREWCTDIEQFAWEVPLANGKVTLHDRRPRMDPERLILYPELIYRHYEGDELVDEAVLKVSMRCYYPDELLNLAADQGFKVVQKWGGYADEPYGEGPELIVEIVPDG